MQWLIDIIKSVVSEVPSGTILAWWGAVVDIPDGYLLCDGNNGTPYLLNKYIIGAGLTYDPGDIVGKVNHKHEFDVPAHYHILNSGSELGGAGERVSVTGTVQGGATAETAIQDGRPPSLAICWIMKT